MKILVTGATGFVGAACADALASAGHNVVRGTRRQVASPRPGETWLNHGDLAGPIDWQSLLAGFDSVVHCAGLASVSGEGAETQAVAINVTATAALADGAAKAGVQRFVFISSALAGAELTDTPYARSKRDAEQRIESIAAQSGMATAAKSGMAYVILRPPMVYGPGCGGNFARLLRMIRRGVPLPLANATAPKSLIAIDNLASAVVAAVAHDSALNRTFAVADAEKISTAELARTMAASVGKSARLVPVPQAMLQTLGQLTRKEREIRSLFEPLALDISDIQKTLQWTPSVRAHDGIRQAVQASIAQQQPTSSNKKIVFLATEDWFVCSHFLPLIAVARKLDLDVVVVARVRQHRAALEAAGARVVPIDVDRSSLNPFGVIGTCAQLVKILRREKPAIVHCIALRMVLLGGLAARVASVPGVVLAPTGLGYLWMAHGWKPQIARRLIRFVTGTILPRPGIIYVFENRDDPRDLGLDPASNAVVIVPGSGVDPAVFAASPEPPSPPMKVAVVARMTRAKGVLTSIDAVRRARAKGADVELHLFGSVDHDNLGAIPQSQLQALNAEAGMAWHGASNDIPSVWRTHHVAMLLTTYREGIPRSLIEATACARPIIATDAIGCREVVRNGVDGILVPPSDVEAAADALVRLAADPALRQTYGAAAHQRFLSTFTEEIVRDRVAGVYRRLLDQRHNAAPLKRAIDVVASLVGLMLTWPLIALGMLAVRLETSGAPLFRQIRLGQNKQPFTLYKIRSMHIGVKNDATHTMPASATTRVGNILRRTKLDELPQLINVLRGEMSLVGPRPCLPTQAELIAARDRLGVFDMRPGVTGLAQVRGIDMSDPEHLAAIDHEYMQAASTALDLKLIAATAFGRRFVRPL